MNRSPAGGIIRPSYPRESPPDPKLLARVQFSEQHARRIERVRFRGGTHETRRDRDALGRDIAYDSRHGRTSYPEVHWAYVAADVSGVGLSGSFLSRHRHTRSAGRHRPAGAAPGERLRRRADDRDGRRGRDTPAARPGSDGRSCLLRAAWHRRVRTMARRPDAPSTGCDTKARVRRRWIVWLLVLAGWTVLAIFFAVS